MSATNKPGLPLASHAPTPSVDVAAAAEPEAPAQRRRSAPAAVEPALPPAHNLNPRIPEPTAIAPSTDRGVRASRGPAAVRLPESPLAREVLRRMIVQVPEAIASDPQRTTRHLVESYNADIQNQLAEIQRRDRAPQLSSAQRLEIVLAWAAQAAKDRRNVVEEDGVVRYDTRSALTALLVLASSSNDVQVSAQARRFATFAATQLEQELVDGGMSREQARAFVRRTATQANASARGWQAVHREAATSAWYRDLVQAAEAHPPVLAPAPTGRVEGRSPELRTEEGNAGAAKARLAQDTDEERARREAAQAQVERNLGQRRIAQLESEGKPVGGTPGSFS